MAPFGYAVQAVEVRRCLHLKSAVTYLDGDTVLINRSLIDAAPLGEYRMLDVPPEEPWAANTLSLGGVVLIPAAYPKTAALLERSGFHVRPIDISELMKAESGLTCSSLIFVTSQCKT